MGDPTPSDKLGIGRTLTDILRRVRNLEKSIRRRLAVASLFASGDIGSGGAVTGASVSAFGPVSGSTVNASVSMSAPTGEFDDGLVSQDVRERVLAENVAAVYVDEAGQLGTMPSTRKLKDVAGTYAVDMAKWLSLPLYQYTYKADPQKRMQVGFLADDMHNAGLREFCLYDRAGNLQGMRTDQLVAGLHSAYIQSRATSIARLTAVEQANTTVTDRVTTLEGKQGGYATGTDLTTLTGRVTTLEGKQSTYALATDLTSLTTRVTTAETNATALTARVKALEDAAKTKLRQRVTSASMAALTVLNSSQTLTVTWPTAFADNNYTPTIVSVTPPSGVLTSISARITAQTTTTVTLLVFTAGIAVSAGTTVTVDGLHL